MKLELQLKEVQNKLDMIKVYRCVETSMNIRFKKGDGVPDAIKKQVCQEIIEFAKKRVSEIESSNGVGEIKSEVVSPPAKLSDEEIECLKMLADKVMMNKKASHDFTFKPEPPKVVVPQKKIEKQKETEKKVSDSEKIYKIVAVSRIEPPKFADFVSVYDEVKLWEVKGDISIVEDIRTGNRFEIPSEDIELK